MLKVVKMLFNMLLSDDVIRRALRESLDELELYHGSKAEFDKFDLAFLSSGWGQQVHGYGVYLTTDYDCASQYSRGGMVYTVEVPSGRYLSDKRISPNTAYFIARKFFEYYTTVDEYGKEAYGGHEKDFWEDGCRYICDCRDGASVYGTISSLCGDDKFTSKFLYSLGFKGLKISEESGDGKRFTNYVMFNADDIRIISRNPL